MNTEREYQHKNWVNLYKSDWPAVRPYRKKLKHLTDWYDCNIPNPPTVDK